MSEVKLFKVSGWGEFPMDMMCYDECQFVHSTAGAVARNGAGLLRQITLRTTNPHAPHVARWKSFGWDVIEVADSEYIAPTYQQAVDQAMKTLSTPLEQEIVHRLGEVWNLFLTLPDNSQDDSFRDEQRNFRDAIHRAQELMLARTGRRQLLLREKITQAEQEWRA